MPALGESVTEGTVTRWLKQVGEAVALDEPLLEVSTDKVDTEIPSPFAGTLSEILVGEDETVDRRCRAGPDRWPARPPVPASGGARGRLPPHAARTRTRQQRPAPPLPHPHRLRPRSRLPTRQQLRAPAPAPAGCPARRHPRRSEPRGRRRT